MTLRTIVVVEDDPIQRLDAAGMMEAAGLSVVAFADGDQALDYIRQHREDVASVFTDIGLATDTGGLEIARLVTDAFPGMVVIVTSGQFAERPDDLDENVRFLAKPWLPLDVINAMIDATMDE
ncbi:MAG: response regulator [Janthinobacterium lividum]